MWLTGMWLTDMRLTDMWLIDMWLTDMWLTVMWLTDLWLICMRLTDMWLTDIFIIIIFIYKLLLSCKFKNSIILMFLSLRVLQTANRHLPLIFIHLDVSLDDGNCVLFLHNFYYFFKLSHRDGFFSKQVYPHPWPRLELVLEVELLVVYLEFQPLNHSLQAAWLTEGMFLDSWIKESPSSPVEIVLWILEIIA